MKRCWNCRWWDAEMEDRWPNSGTNNYCRGEYPVILTPLAISAKAVEEGEKLGIKIKRVGDDCIYGEWPLTDSDARCSHWRRFWSLSLMWQAIVRGYWRCCEWMIGNGEKNDG